MSLSLSRGDPPADESPAEAGEAQLRRRRRRRTLSRAGIIAVMAASVLLVALVASLTWRLPLGKSLEPMTSPTIVLVSADGEAFARRGAYKEAPVDAARLPRHVKMAFVAIEDRRFYRHGGLDPRGIARAMARNLRAGSLSQGGSTITQQLAKNAFTSGKRTFRRKAREAIIALYLESRLTKDEILSRYLSSVYFGDGVFGLRGAARHYFDKAPEDLSIGEAAMLAGLVKAPTRLAPTDNFDAAKARTRVVLAAMRDMGVITAAQASQAERTVRLREGRPELPIGSYFADWISPQAKRAFDRTYGEVRVPTTIDSRLQAQAEAVLRRTLDAEGGRLHATQGAIVAMRTDGAVLAMVGGRDYAASKFNRVTQARRQPGSAFKPIVYLAALQRGATPVSLVSDAPLKLADWEPENHESRYSGGLITLRQAFAKSSNVAAVRLAQETGVSRIQAAARELGIDTPLPNDLTLALGTADLTLLQLTSAYAGIARGETPISPYGLAAEPSPPPHARLGRFERQGLLDMMRAVVTSGTGTAANVGAPAFGKTGTSQDYRDAYFIGFVGDLVIGVWVGNDDNSSMRRVVGGMLPAQMWREVMSSALERRIVHLIPLQDGTSAPAPAVTVAEVEAPDDQAAEADDDGVLGVLRPPPAPVSSAPGRRPALQPPPELAEPRPRLAPPPQVEPAAVDDGGPDPAADPSD